METIINKIMEILENDSDKYEVFILQGLPGAGKTYLADRATQIAADKNFHSELLVVNFDEPVLIGDWFTFGRRVVIIDGLFLTNEELLKTMSYTCKKNSCPCEDIHFNIVHFKENRSACLFNDQNRRAKSSKITIKHSRYEKPDQNLTTKYDFSIFEIETKLKEKDFVLSEECANHVAGGFIFSNKWIASGKRRGYDENYNQYYVPLQAEPPCEFKELEEYLLARYPNVSIQKIKEKVHERCWEVFDYYSTVEYHQYSLDLSILKNFMEE